MKAGFDTEKDRGAFSKNYLITFFLEFTCFCTLSAKGFKRAHYDHSHSKRNLKVFELNIETMPIL